MSLEHDEHPLWGRESLGDKLHYQSKKRTFMPSLLHTDILHPTEWDLVRRGVTTLACPQNGRMAAPHHGSTIGSPSALKPWFQLQLDLVPARLCPWPQFIDQLP